MTQSTADPNVYHFNGTETPEAREKPIAAGWYFFDEAGLLGGGPYKSEEAALRAIREYALSLGAG